MKRKSTKEYPDSAALREIALDNRGIMLRYFHLRGTTTWKKDGTPVTEGDTEVNRNVLNWASHEYPKLDVIGEEGSRRVKKARYRLFFDPIDGTIPYAIGLPVSTFCAAVIDIKTHKPVAAVIFDPFLNRMWSVDKGKGAELRVYTVINSQNGRGPYITATDPLTLKVSKTPTLRRSHVCMCWWKGSPYHLHDVAHLIMEDGAKLLNACSIAYFGGLLASGNIEATVFPGNNAWETAAMQLLAEESGGKATNIHGKPLRYGPNGETEGHIISNGLVHARLVKLIASWQ